MDLWGRLWGRSSHVRSTYSKSSVGSDIDVIECENILERLALVCNDRDTTCEVYDDHFCCHGLMCIRVQVLCTANLTKFKSIQNLCLDPSAVASVSGSSDFNRALVQWHVSQSKYHEPLLWGGVGWFQEVLEY